MQRDLHVVAIAYRSKDPTPGLWVDAFSRVPTVMDALQALYEEFVQTGEAANASFEQFMQSAQPNVLILSPDELKSFAARKEQST